MFHCDLGFYCHCHNPCTEIHRTNYLPCILTLQFSLPLWFTVVHSKQIAALRQPLTCQLNES